MTHAEAQAVFEKITEALKGSGYLAGWFGSTARGHGGNDLDVMVVQADRAARDPLGALTELADIAPRKVDPDPRVTFETWALLVDGFAVDVHLHRWESQA